MITESIGEGTRENWVQNCTWNRKEIKIFRNEESDCIWVYYEIILECWFELWIWFAHEKTELLSVNYKVYIIYFLWILQKCLERELCRNEYFYNPLITSLKLTMQAKYKYIH